MSLSSFQEDSTGSSLAPSACLGFKGVMGAFLKAIPREPSRLGLRRKARRIDEGPSPKTRPSVTTERLLQTGRKRPAGIAGVGSGAVRRRRCLSSEWRRSLLPPSPAAPPVAEPPASPVLAAGYLRAGATAFVALPPQPLASIRVRAATGPPPPSIVGDTLSCRCMPATTPETARLTPIPNLPDRFIEACER